MRGRDLGALASGAVIGAVVTLMAVLIWTEMSRPGLFPTTTVTALPTRAVIPTPTARPELPPRGELPLTLTPEGLGLVSFGEEGDATVQKLEGLLGPSNGDEHWTCPDPPGEVHFVQWADLGVFVIDGVFVGWVDAIFYPPEFGPLLELKTTEDLRIGVELEQFEAYLGDRFVFREPEPDAAEGAAREFDIDGATGIHGFVQDGQGASLVIALSAGTTCFDDTP